MSEEKNKPELNEQEQAVLDAITKNIDAQIEGKASKEDIASLTKEVSDKLDAFKTDLNYESMQKQLDKLFERTDRMNSMPDPRKAEVEEKQANQKWLRAFLKRDKGEMMAVKEGYANYFTPSLHAGQAGIGAATAEQGEYTIPELLLAEINRYILEGGVCRREMRYLPFSGPGNERDLLVGATSVVVQWLDEGERKPKTKPTITKVTQKLYKLAAITVMTEEIVEDSAIDLISYVGQLFAEEIAIAEDTMFFNGDVLTGDPVNGILNAAGVTALAMTAGLGPNDVNADTLNQMIYAITTPARRGAKYFMHPELFGILQRLKDNEGNYIIQKPVNAGDPGSIWNYPIVLSDELPAPGDVAVDDPFMFFANLNRTSVYGDKQGLRVKMLDQASITDTGGDQINLAEHDLLAMRVHKRVGYVNVLPQGICVLSAGEAT